MSEFLWGGLMAALHFGGLWWTLRRHPAAPLGLSRLVRMAATGAGFGLLAGGGPVALALGTAGFLAVRAGALVLAWQRRGGV